MVQYSRICTSMHTCILVQMREYCTTEVLQLLNLDACRTIRPIAGGEVKGGGICSLIKAYLLIL